MKKAFQWLDERGVDYVFHDYKKEGVDEGVLKRALDVLGWEGVINKRGTTWRALPEDMQNNMDKNKALQTALDHPSIIKRPLLIHKNNIYLGFKAETYSGIF